MDTSCIRAGQRRVVRDPSCNWLPNLMRDGFPYRSPLSFHGGWLCPRVVLFTAPNLRHRTDLDAVFDELALDESKQLTYAKVCMVPSHCWAPPGPNCSRVPKVRRPTAPPAGCTLHMPHRLTSAQTPAPPCASALYYGACQRWQSSPMRW